MLSHPLPTTMWRKRSGNNYSMQRLVSVDQHSGEIADINLLYMFCCYAEALHILQQGA